MATVPTMANWTAGEKPTAAKLTTNIRDAGNFALNHPSASMSSTVGTSLPAGAWTKIDFNTSDFDNDGLVDLVNNKFTIVTPGFYLLSAMYSFSASATGVRALGIGPSTGLFYSRVQGPATSSDGSYSGSLTGMAYLAAGVHLYLWAFQASGGSMTPATGADTGPRFAITWLAK